MVPKTIHEYESTHAAKEHGLTKSATSPIQKVRKILDTTVHTLDELEGKWADIEGWCNPASFLIWRYLLRKQREFSCFGHVMEVGAWMGKTASILAAHADATQEEKIILIDIQIKAPEIEAALKLAGLKSLESVHLHEVDSRMISTDDLGIKPRSVRWFHIDGEHSGPSVISDLDLAHQLTKESGIVVVDDFFKGLA